MADIDWDTVEAAVQRGVREYARAYFIPANGLCGNVPQLQDQLAGTWGELAAPHIVACVREDLRKAAPEAGDQHGE